MSVNNKEDFYKEKREEALYPNGSDNGSGPRVEETDSVQEGELLIMDDDILAKKIHLANQALNEIGFTPYHWKMFCMNGMGYAVDSLLTLLHSVCQVQINKEFKQDFSALVSANYVGLLIGALFWGLTADIIGRRIAFHVTLFVTALFGMATAGGLNYVAVCSLSAVCYFGAGGNLVLDAVTFLEYLPSNKQWMVTLMALWWGLGQIVTCAIAWPLIANFSCESEDDCPRASNMGWRYTYICTGGFVFLCAASRILFVRMLETPKYDLSNGNDERVIINLDKIAASAGRTNPLTLEDLSALGHTKVDKSQKSFKEIINPRAGLADLGYHIRGLFANRKLGISTVLNMASWGLIGFIYTLFNGFLPTYLSARGAAEGESDIYTTYRNNLVVTTCSIFGPVIAAGLCEIPRVGRKGSLTIGALLTMTFMFAYTAVSTPAQNLGLSCAINVCLNIYYGTLYAYTPEVMPSAHRSTGNGLSVSVGRVFSIIAPVIAYYGNTASAIPLYVMAGCFATLAIISVCFPFEPRGKQSM